VINHGGIQTIYHGVKMRSRLEARWAAFFDAMNWPWAYEPFDLEGYVPDFVIMFDRPLLVEVKPYLNLQDLKPAARKTDGSGWTGEALVVMGAILEEYSANPICGILGELSEVPVEVREWSEARLFACLSCGSASVLAADLHWRCRVCGAGDGNAHVGRFDNQASWTEAANQVQWRAGA
jgi:hypothetical protein